MSVRHVAWVWERSRAEGGTLLVALALADSVNALEGSDECWPKVDRLGTMVRLSARQITRCLRELEELGEIETRRTQDGNHYRFLMPDQTICPVDADVRSPQSPTSDSGQTPTSDSMENRKVEPGKEPELGDGGDQLFAAPDNVALVWAHYQSAVKGAGRRKLDSTRRTLIRNALRVRDVAKVMLAIDGLASSAWHNGANENRTEYLDIRYALKGNAAKGESNEARIDSMAEKAGRRGPDGRTTVQELLATVPSGGADIVRLRMERVRQMIDVQRKVAGGGSIGPVDRDQLSEGEIALRQLRESSPHCEPVIEEHRLVAWRRAA